MAEEEESSQSSSSSEDKSQQSEEHEDGAEDTGDDNGLEGETVNVDFDAVKPVEDDYFGIRCLLKQLFRNADVDLSGLSNLIVAQPELTSVVKIFNDEDGEGEPEEKKKKVAC